MSRFASSYYVVNALVILAYAVTRALFSPLNISSYSRIQAYSELLQGELRAAGLVSLILVFKFLKRRSIDEFVQEVFFFSKILMLYLYTLMDSRLTVIFALLCALVYVLGEPPAYDGPRSYTKLFTPQSFEDAIATDKEKEKLKLVSESSDPRKSKRWLVMFGAKWSSESAALIPSFGDLSMTYESDSLKFGEVDVAVWPQLAEQHKISDRTWDKQIPTVIMFESGKEVARVPGLAITSKSSKTRGMKKKDIVSAFGLDSGKVIKQ